jgi:hypothetical protein
MFISTLVIASKLIYCKQFNPSQVITLAEPKLFSDELTSLANGLSLRN